LVILEAFSLYLLTLVPTNLLIIPCSIFGFSTYGLLGTTDAFLADITPRNYMATIFGFHFTVSFFNQVIVSPIFGLIVDYSKSFDPGFVMLSVIALSALPILYKVKTKS
jgi:MFS family permease